MPDTNYEVEPENTEIPDPSGNAPPRKSKVYKNAQGIELEEDSEGKKWGLRLGFYTIYYFFIYLLYLLSLNIIEGYTHDTESNQLKPVTQGRLGSPRMTLFPLDQIREIDWIARSGVDNHLWYNAETDSSGKSMRQAYADLLDQKLTNMKDQEFATKVRDFCEGEYAQFQNGKACFLVSVNTAVGWAPEKIDMSKPNWFKNVKIGTSNQDFDLESQGLNVIATDAKVLFGCRVFSTKYTKPICKPDYVDGKPNSVGQIVTNGIEWMNGTDYLSEYPAFQGGINPKSGADSTDIYEECTQPAFTTAKCNINQYDYTNWAKPYAVMKIDTKAITGIQTDKGYEFKCNAYAQNIVSPMYNQADNLYYEGQNDEPVVQSGGKDLHQNFIIQFED